MNSNMAGLGEALASDYQNKLNQWSAIAELSFSGDEFSSSIALANDVLRFEEGLQVLTSLSQSLQTNYISQNLIAASGPAILPPEQQALSSDFLRKAKNYPFVSEAALPDKPVSFPATQEQVLPENETRELTNLSSPVAAALLSKQHVLTSNSLKKAENYPFEQKNVPDTSEKSAAAQKQIQAENKMSLKTNLTSSDNNFDLSNIKQTLSPLPANEYADSIQNKNLSGLDKFSFFEAQTSPQPSVLKTTGQPDTYSDSIWIQPLKNLNDFAAQTTYPTKLTEPAVSAYINVQKKDQSILTPEQMMLGESGNRENKPLSLQFDQSGFMSQTEQSAYYEPENLPLTTQAMPLFDTDDLLEALTERIYKDFRRYYP